jgi:hypothetical protein
MAPGILLPPRAAGAYSRQDMADQKKDQDSLTFRFS